MSWLKKLVKRIYPNIGKDYFLLRAILRHRSFSPDRAVLPLGNYLYADWSEPRGRAIIIGNAKGQLNVKEMWNKIIEQLTPDIVLDCGANYGEFVFYPAYPDHTKVFAIEADSNLIPYLELSKKDHRDAKKIQIINAFVGDTDDMEIDFLVDKTWSGRSSALSNHKVKSSDVELRKMSTITIDSLLSESSKGKKLAFKFDIEGYEPFVFKGMVNSLKNLAAAVGIIEYNRSFLVTANISPEDYVNNLKIGFSIFVLKERNWLRVEGFDELNELVGDKPSDLLLVSPAILNLFDQSILSSS